jgi:cytochrome-b5 reductase
VRLSPSSPPFFVTPADVAAAPVGRVDGALVKEHVAPASENVKVLVCGPPGMVAALAGKKDGMKQGALAGALKELGYEEGQVFKF